VEKNLKVKFQIFRIFDRDGNGSIDFKEFMMATDMTFSGTPEEKLAWAFKVKTLKDR
jgi:Ca2+-binding EF-hand superfamily protein